MLPVHRIAKRALPAASKSGVTSSRCRTSSLKSSSFAPVSGTTRLSRYVACLQGPTLYSRFTQKEKHNTCILEKCHYFDALKIYRLEICLWSFRVFLSFGPSGCYCLHDNTDYYYMLVSDVVARTTTRWIASTSCHVRPSTSTLATTSRSRTMPTTTLRWLY